MALDSAPEIVSLLAHILHGDVAKILCCTIAATWHHAVPFHSTSTCVAPTYDNTNLFYRSPQDIVHALERILSRKNASPPPV